jgi:hypothetical protein
LPGLALGPDVVGFQTIRAFATITNDFEVSAEPGTEGNTVAAWITYDVDWDGRILLIGFLSKPSVEIAIQLFDLTESGKAIEGETIWAPRQRDWPFDSVRSRSLVQHRRWTRLQRSDEYVRRRLEAWTSIPDRVEARV